MVCVKTQLEKKMRRISGELIKQLIIFLQIWIYTAQKYDSVLYKKTVNMLGFPGYNTTV